MNCTQLLEQLGFECAPRPNSGLRVFSPFSFDDGSGIGVYVEPLPGGDLLVTDHGDAFMHLSMHGLPITKRRIHWAADRCRGVKVSDDGVLQVVATPDRLGHAIASVMDASITIGHQLPEWRPKIHEDRFIDAVANVISNASHRPVLRSVNAVGISGHQLEFPLGFLLSDRTTAFIQPISANEDHIDWQAVYRTSGKMSDIQQAGIDADRRIVVVDDAAAPNDAPRAIKLLNSCATVLRFSARDSWISRFSA